MLSERIRNAPLLTFDDAVDLFEAATGSLPEPFSMNQFIQACEWETATALAVSASEISVEQNATPVGKS